MKFLLFFILISSPVFSSTNVKSVATMSTWPTPYMGQDFYIMTPVSNVSQRWVYNGSIFMPYSVITPTGSPTLTSTITNTPTNTPTFTNTPTNTPTFTVTNTSTNTPTNTPTGTWAPSGISGSFPGANSLANFTSGSLQSTTIYTPTSSPTNSPTNTPTNTVTNTPTPNSTNQLPSVNFPNTTNLYGSGVYASGGAVTDVSENISAGVTSLNLNTGAVTDTSEKCSGAATFASLTSGPVTAGAVTATSVNCGPLTVQGTPVTGGGGGGGITALTGDVTASGSGSVAASVVNILGVSLASIANTAGKFLMGNGTNIVSQSLSGDVSGVSGTGAVTLNGTTFGGWKQPVACIKTQSNLAGTLSSGVFTVTATGTLTIDGVLTTLGMRVALAGQTTTTQNGIYTVTTAGASGVNAVLTFASDWNSVNSAVEGSLVSVQQGLIYTGSIFSIVDGAGTITPGTSSVTFTQPTISNGITAPGTAGNFLVSTSTSYSGAAISGDLISGATSPGSVTVQNIAGIPLEIQHDSDSCWKSPVMDSTLGAFTTTTATAYFVYIGQVGKAFTPKHVAFFCSVAGSLSVDEVGIFTTPAAPNASNQTLTKVTSGVFAAGTGIVENTSNFATALTKGTYVWVGLNTTSTVATVTNGLTDDYGQGSYLTTASPTAFATGTTYTGVATTTQTALTAVCPQLILTNN